MRVFGVAIAAIFLTTVPVTAQDLQFRIQTRVNMADNAANTGAFPELNIFLKNTRVRIDVEMPTPNEAISSSMIMDDTAQSALMVMHGDKSYTISPNPFSNVNAKGDTMEVNPRDPAAEPTVLRTGERARIAGYDAVRVVTTVEMPGGMGVLTREPALFITDSWIATDAALNAAYRPFAQRSASMMSSGVPGADALSVVSEGFPLRTTNLVLTRPATKPDPLATLKEAKPAGLLMRMETEVTEVKLGLLPDSLFKVPAGYVHRAR